MMRISGGKVPREVSGIPGAVATISKRSMSNHRGAAATWCSVIGRSAL